jgi:hypothetical protein
MTSSTDPLVRNFEEFIRTVWSKGFDHRYSISDHRSWKKWRSREGSQNLKNWTCDSLAQAAEHYSWPDDTHGRSFPDLSRSLIAGISTGDDRQVADICLSIFSWGGVASGSGNASRVWVLERLAARNLSQSLADARNLLCDRSSDLRRFDGSDLLMNSAMTKVYAASDPEKLIIYDGRVGAALGLLVRRFLISVVHPGPVPPELSFAWGASKEKTTGGEPNKRNPSTEKFRFPSLFRQHPDLNHAGMMRKASFLLTAVVEKSGGQSHLNLPGLEKALFMIGYDVAGEARRDRGIF